MTNKNEVESVWDYPRPPRLEAAGRAVKITHCGIVIAESSKALRILETSHPPVYYIPPSDIAMKYMVASPRRNSFCEFKGSANYWTVDVSRVTSQDGAVSPDAAWSYTRPSASYAGLRDHLAFYATRVDECMVDGERVAPQEGDFYGGWITSQVKGPFKGAPGTLGW